MDLSIIIINWNTCHFLAKCLQSIEENAGKRSPLRIETFVVDNASTDGSPQMVRERFSQVRLIENERNVGFALANNQAIRQSQGQYVLLLNSDTEVHPGALETMMQFMDIHSRVAGCGSLLLNGDGSLQTSCHPILTPGREFWRLMFLDRLWHRATYMQTKWDRRIPRQVEVVKGACFMLRRTALDQVGLLDEQYFMYTEEMDLCHRLLQAGWEIWWVPQAVVTHYGEASTRQAAEEMYVQLYRSKMQFHRKFGGDRQASKFRRLIMLAYWPRSVIMALASRFHPELASRARIYCRLLAELPAM
jgi:N-acetylglucosaminyl-diphospho-decaprenol L-rhamnosyltransferase